MNCIKNIELPGSDNRAITMDIFFEEYSSKLPVIIYCHGFNGFKDWGNFDLVAKKVVAAGFVFVKFNFSHNGTTVAQPDEFADLDAFGKNNFSRELEDLLLVTNWVTDSKNDYAKWIDAAQIYLIGHSMGGGVATIFASEDKRIKKLITWAGINECKTPWGNWTTNQMQDWKAISVQYYTNSRTNQQMPLYYQLYEDFEKNKQRFDIKEAARNIKIPWLICHGTLDIAVPVEVAYELKETQPEATLFIVESNHVFDRKHPWIMNYLPDAMNEVVEKSIDFLKKPILV